MRSSSLELHSVDHYISLGIVAQEFITEVMENVEVGMSTLEVDYCIYSLLNKFHITSAINGHCGYKHNSTISVNCVTCNQPPSIEIVLQKGDLLTIDVPIKISGIVLDLARCFVLQNDINFSCAAGLVEAAKDINSFAISIINENITIGEVHLALMEFANSRDLNLVDLPFGHVSGTSLHLYPNFSQRFSDFNFSQLFSQFALVTVEPILATTAEKPILAADMWSWKLPTGNLACYNENVVLLSKDSPPVFIC